MFVLIGDLALERLSSPTAFELRVGAEYPEHEVIEGKPLLQWTGDRLDELRLSLYVHADFGSPPQQTWDALTGLLRRHEAVPVSMGNGAQMGMYVIEALNRTTSWAADDGTLYAFSCDIDLKEWADADRTGAAKAMQRANAPALLTPGGTSRVPAVNTDIFRPASGQTVLSSLLPAGAGETIADVLSLARDAASLVQVAKAITRSW